jgi:glycosyltransferase involved in cell wall biosynthesis
VYDNNSSDRTRQIAGSAGAVVRNETLQGKGHVVRRMFADIEADIYVLVDGDNTYDPAAAPVMVRQLMENRLDMVTAVRLPAGQDAYRPGHRIGNRVLSFLVCRVFGNRISDVLSGYRVFSRRFVKSFPALATGFETETEFTIHALELRMPIGELITQYRGRVAGSRSKLHTVSDGIRILRTIMKLVKQERPFQSFGLTGAALLTVGLALGLPVVLQFLHSGMVPRLPTALLATGLVLASSLSFVCGFVLEQVTRGRQELKRLAYLSIPAIGSNQ